MESKKITIATPCKTRVLDYKKDWMTINYYLATNYIGKPLKWHQKLRLYLFCKFHDLKAMIVKG